MTANPQTECDIHLAPAVVIGVTEDACTVWSGAGPYTVDFAPQFPTPRMDRVHPGHLVAIATSPDGRRSVVWRWFDAVVLDGAQRDFVRLWEPGHGEVSARGSDHYQTRVPGSRAYASAGLHDGEWWVAGPVVPNPGDADVELDAVRALYADNDLWSSAFGETE